MIIIKTITKICFTFKKKLQRTLEKFNPKNGTLIDKFNQQFKNLLMRLEEFNPKNGPLIDKFNQHTILIGR